MVYGLGMSSQTRLAKIKNLRDAIEDTLRSIADVADDTAFEMACSQVSITLTHLEDLYDAALKRAREKP